MEAFSIGQRVLIVLTGQEGQIREDMGDQLFSVYIEDLERTLPFAAEHLQALPNEKEVSPSLPDGVHLALVQSEQYWDAYLLNGHAHAIWYAVTLLVSGRQLHNEKGKIKSQNTCKLYSLHAEQLSDGTAFGFMYGHIQNGIAGSGQKVHLRIKTKTLFEGLSFLDALHAQARLYPLRSVRSERKPGESLTDYDARMHADRFADEQDEETKQWSGRNLLAFTAFDRKLDLHAEVLLENADKLSPQEIFAEQLSRFEDYLEEAIILGVQQVTVIHGLGSGRLRDEIHHRLRKHPYVASFNNEFDASYGFGATQIRIQ